jgi:hypothetical protein
MHIKTFCTRALALAEIAMMRGWNTAPVMLYMPDDEQANTNGNVWVVEVRDANSDPVYLREDGFVS